MGFFVGVHGVRRFKIALDINVFQVVDYADMTVARNAFVVGAEISLDASAFTAGFHD
jgi:hypothetical protein